MNHLYEHKYTKFIEHILRAIRFDQASNSSDDLPSDAMHSSTVVNGLNLEVNGKKYAPLLVHACDKSSPVDVGLCHDWVGEQGVLTGVDNVLQRITVCLNLLLEVVAGYAVEEDLVIITVVVDGDSVVVALKSVSECDSLLLEPGTRFTSIEDDHVLDATKANVQHGVAVISKEVEAGVVDFRAQVELRGAVDDDSIGFDAIKFGGLVNGNEVEAGHSSNLRDTVGGYKHERYANI